MLVLIISYWMKMEQRAHLTRENYYLTYVKLENSAVKTDTASKPDGNVMETMTAWMGVTRMQ